MRARFLGKPSQRFLASVGATPGALHNRGEPEPCETCSRETCGRRFDGRRWVVTCAQCVFALLDAQGVETTTEGESSWTT